MGQIKIFMGFLLFLVTFLSGSLLVLFCHQFARRWYLIAYLDLLGRGLLLGVGLFHFLPEGIAQLASLAAQSSFLLFVVLSLCVLVLFFFFGNFAWLRKVTDLLGEVAEPTPLRWLVPLTLVTLLSLHAFSEGLVLGANVSIISLSGIAVAVLLHKTSEAFTLTAMRYNQSLAIHWQLMVLTFFAAMTPLGMWCGHQLNFQAQLLQLPWFGVFNLFAAMIFIYIALSCRVWCQFQQKHMKRVYGAGMFALGLVLMGLLVPFL